MRKRAITTSASALLLFIASLVSAKHTGVHEHLEALHRRHRATRDISSTAELNEEGVEVRSVGEIEASASSIEKRQGQCIFPSDAGLVAVTPGSQNGGWAMSPNQPCTPGSYCPYACPPGQVMMQWDPSATAYTYPQSMHGGLYCDQNGNIQKPFPDRPYCQSTSSNIGVQNNAGSVVSFCQTVLPGNEAMLIPTTVTDYANLAVPDTSYWCKTAAHYYINPPGVGSDQACLWGDNRNPRGNWTPYVAGANTDDSGNTFIKLGWNPIYLEAATPFRTTVPNWGVKIDCPNGGCNGLPCSIDPSQNGVNEMTGSSSDGAGGGAFCVVTVNKGSTANFVVFNTGGSQSSGSGNNGGGGGQGGHGGNNGGQWGGQFFGQSGSSSSPTTTSSSTQSTTTSTTTSSSEEWSSSSATTTSAVPTWSETTTHHNSSTLPTHSPYYSLFNHTTYTPTAEATVFEATATPSGPSTSAIATITPGTGAATTTQLSAFAVLFGLTLGLVNAL